jgi:hypothetical protein
MNILVEEWGGKYQTQEISAKKGKGVDQLLEKVLLESEMLDLKADPGKRAHGVVIESTLEQGRGYVTTLLVDAGTLRKGDIILAGQYSGRVRNMFNERGQQVTEATPSHRSPSSVSMERPTRVTLSRCSRTSATHGPSPHAASNCSASRASVPTSTSRWTRSAVVLPSATSRSSTSSSKATWTVPWKRSPIHC